MLFYLPVTKAWLRQVVLGLVRLCHSSFRGVIGFFRDLLDQPIALGTVHNIVAEAVVEARRINARQDLSRVRAGSHDELFQAHQPVLVGIDLDSTIATCWHWKRTVMPRPRRFICGTWPIRGCSPIISWPTVGRGYGPVRPTLGRRCPATAMSFTGYGR